MKHFRNLSAWVLVVLIYGFLATVPAMAQSCDATVSDQANLFGKDFGKVTSAAEALIAKGAEVRVVTMPGLSGRDIDQFEKDMERDCVSWRKPGSADRRNGLIAVIYTPELSASAKASGRKTNGQSGIFPGRSWDAAFRNNQTARIRKDIMSPRFADHDYASAMALALADMTRLLDLQLHPPAPTSTSTSTVIVQPPADYSGAWKIIKWFLICVFLLIVVLLAYSVFVALKKKGDEQKGAQQKALIAQQQFTMLSGQIREGLAEFLATTEKGFAERVQTLFDSALESYSNLKRGSMGDPNAPGLTQEQYLAIAEAYEELVRQLRLVERLMKGKSVAEEPASPPPQPPVQEESSEPPREERHTSHQHEREHRHPHREEGELEENSPEAPIVPVFIPVPERTEEEPPSFEFGHGHRHESEPEPEPESEPEPATREEPEPEPEESNTNDSSGDVVEEEATESSSGTEEEPEASPSESSTDSSGDA